MSLNIPVQKDIGEYEEKIVGKLSFRTLACVAGGFASAIAVAAISYFWIGIEVSNAAFPVMLASMPFWLCGFWRPFGMRAEKFLPLLIDHHANSQKLVYATYKDPFITSIKRGTPSRKAKRKLKKRGAEGYEPSKQDEQTTKI